MKDDGHGAGSAGTAAPRTPRGVSAGDSGTEAGARGRREFDPDAAFQSLLDEVESVSRQGERTTVGDIVDSFGRSSFSPVLLLAGALIVTPVIGDIPGVPTAMAALAALAAAQILLHRRSLWLPRWLLRRSVASARLRKALRWLRRPARWVDRWTRPRYRALVHSAGAFVMAGAVIFVASITPILELIPFSATFTGLAIFAFGLALMVEDGLIAVAAMACSAAAIGFLVEFLPF
jgi:hypothetical protein